MHTLCADCSLSLNVALFETVLEASIVFSFYSCVVVECIFPVDSITRQEVSEVDSFVTSLPSLDIIAIMKRFALVLAKRSNLLW